MTACRKTGRPGFLKGLAKPVIGDELPSARDVVPYTGHLGSGVAENNIIQIYMALEWKFWGMCGVLAGSGLGEDVLGMGPRLLRKA